MVIGHTSNIGIANHNGRFQLHGTDYDTATMSIVHNGTDSFGPFLFFASQRSGSPGGSTVLQNNDAVGTIRFHAGDGTDMASYCAAIQVKIDGTPGSNDVPGRIMFSTTADGAASPTERLRIESDGDFRLSSDNAATNYGFIRGWDASTGNMIIGADQSATGSSGSNLIFRTRGGERARIINSGGITFNGDTADANALDDYEEGTFNPTFVTSSGSISMNTSYDTLAYTKIGRMVHIMGQVVLSVSSPGGNLDLASLPFAFAQLTETSERGWALNVGYFNGSSPAGSNHFAFQVRAGENAGTTTTRLHGVAPNDDGSIADWCGNGTDLWFNFWYLTS